MKRISKARVNIFCRNIIAKQSQQVQPLIRFKSPSDRRNLSKDPKRMKISSFQGTLMCNEEPAANVKVKLYDEEVTIDALLDEE